MCGIYGMVADGAALRHPEVLGFMGEALRHRGPDGHAEFARAEAAIGTERLRIIDLHERADQPFAAPGSQVWLECNGEIYNAAEIRARYPDYPYRSKSDVETILPLYLERGVAAIPELDGMFGLAIWDARIQTLILARDRAGEKPLFYAKAGTEVIFASELQCLLRHPGISRELDPIAIGEYLRLGYVPEPRTPFRDVRRIEAGTFVRFHEGDVDTVRYWDPASFRIERISARAAIDETQRLVERAVEKQVMSDVPVGVFTSGGLDSSILATLAAKFIGVDRVHTYSAAFAEQSFDESPVAETLAKRIRTRYVPVRTDAETLTEALQVVVRGVAEPLSDPAILPTFLLARTARQHVKVILSGEGADELFGGYPTYLGHKIAPVYDAMPSFVRAILRRAVQRVPSSTKKVTVEFLLKRFVSDAEKPWIERHLAWFGTGLAPSVYKLGSELPDLPLSGGDALAGAMLLDYRSYLRDNLLVKVDRATMLSSVEARAPFLDRDVTRFALSLPTDLRIRRFETKWVLKKAAERWLPKDVIYRRKRGLSVPIASWINGGLRHEVDRLLAPARLRDQGLLDEQHVAGLLSAHRSGRANNAKPLWALIVLQYWIENWAKAN
ncbi:MAG: asparagine synthase (glutamine-hydrolyzing) [Acidobacteria bacterium]|nr:asparagine synthase (glutamine-hydrolyzing) [Acidobacteriota bacterium]MBV9069936.1 asparagine synthase (glutamine-hydrolyzing) [Acidobacteriota bacterium]MBV9185852.1 asparagine synthase (glutamine-hydrolyzing) [Acidobacteriota bacterium]